MNRTFFLAAAGLLVLVGVAVWRTISQATPVEAARVERGAIQQFVDEQGKTRLPREYVLSMPFAGRLEPIALEPGDAVRAGQVVARIVPDDLAIEVAEAQAAVERLEAALVENDDRTVEETTRQQAELFVRSMADTVKAALARVTAGRKRLDYAETFLGRVANLERTGARTRDDLDRAELEHVEAQVNYQQDMLVWQAMVSIQAATELLPQMVGQYIDRKQLTHAVLDRQKAEAQARLRHALLRQERGAVRSPVDGVVLERFVDNEQQLGAGSELLTVGQIDRLEVEADLLSQDVVAVRPGARAIVYGAAVGHVLDDGAPGRVARIHPAGFTKISSLGVEQQRVRVIVDFDDEVRQRLRADDIGSEFRVRVRVITAERVDTLIVPRSALFRGPEGGWQVFVIRGGRAVLQPVEVGLLNDQAAEIIAGLAAGELVVIAPESALTAHQRVSPRGVSP